jgi:hypothetical protein
MDVWVKEGGDPNLWWYKFGIHRFEAPDNIIKEIQEQMFPNLKPLKIEVPLTQLPPLKCCACGSSLPSKATLEETLSQTHVHFSLVLDDGTVFLLDLVCAAKIRDFLEERCSPGKLVYPT